MSESANLTLILTLFLTMTITITIPRTLTLTLTLIGQGHERQCGRGVCLGCIDRMLNGKVVGAAGLHIEPRRSYCGEIGYFVDEAYWGRGIACDAVRQLEQIAFNEMGLVRIEINMLKKNKASERVALKCGYRKEGIGRKKLLLNGEYLDCCVYSKVRK